MLSQKHDGNFVAYYRVKRPELPSLSLSENQQKDKVRSFLNGGTWVLIGEFTEHEGRQTRRPTFQDALKFCKDNDSTLIMATIDPLSRNAYFLGLLRDSGVPFLVCDQPELERKSLSILTRLAEKEAGLASARIKPGIAKAKANGVKFGSPRPQHGAERSGEVVHLKADRHAERILPIIKMLRGEGHASYREIAQALNAMGVETARGGKWFASTVRNIEKRSH